MVSKQPADSWDAPKKEFCQSDFMGFKAATFEICSQLCTSKHTCSNGFYYKPENLQCRIPYPIGCSNVTQSGGYYQLRDQFNTKPRNRLYWKMGAGPWIVQPKDPTLVESKPRVATVTLAKPLLAGKYSLQTTKDAFSVHGQAVQAVGLGEYSFEIVDKTAPRVVGVWHDTGASTTLQLSAQCAAPETSGSDTGSHHTDQRFVQIVGGGVACPCPVAGCVEHGGQLIEGECDLGDVEAAKVKCMLWHSCIALDCPSVGSCRARASTHLLPVTMASLANSEEAWIFAAQHTEGQPVVITWDRPIVLDPNADSPIEIFDLSRNITIPVGTQDMAVYGHTLTISLPEQSLQPATLYSLVIKEGASVTDHQGNPSLGLPVGTYLLQTTSFNSVHNITTLVATVGLSQLPLNVWQAEAKPMERAFMNAISSVVHTRGLKMEVLISNVQKGIVSGTNVGVEIHTDAPAHVIENMVVDLHKALNPHKNYTTDSSELQTAFEQKLADVHIFINTSIVAELEPCRRGTPHHTFMEAKYEAKVARAKEGHSKARESQARERLTKAKQAGSQQLKSVAQDGAYKASLLLTAANDGLEIAKEKYDISERNYYAARGWGVPCHEKCKELGAKVRERAAKRAVAEKRAAELTDKKEKVIKVEELARIKVKEAGEKVKEAGEKQVLANKNAAMEAAMRDSARQKATEEALVAQDGKDEGLLAGAAVCGGDHSLIEAQQVQAISRLEDKLQEQKRLLDYQVKLCEDQDTTACTQQIEIQAQVSSTQMELDKMADELQQLKSEECDDNEVPEMSKADRERQEARLALIAQEKAVKLAYKNKVTTVQQTNSFAVDYMEIPHATISETGTQCGLGKCIEKKWFPHTLHDAETECKNLCSTTWWCQVMNYDRKRNTCTMLQKQPIRADLTEVSEDTEHDVLIRITSFAERRHGKKISKSIIEARQAAAALKRAIELGEWICPYDKSQYASVKASKGSCRSNVAFAAGTTQRMSPECLIEFHIASAQIYGSALIKHAELLKNCSAVAPISRYMEKLALQAKEEGADMVEKQREIAIADAVQNSKDMIDEIGLNMDQISAESRKAVSAEDKSVLELIASSMTLAKRALKSAIEGKDATDRLEGDRAKQIEANETIATKERAIKESVKWNWRCSSDPVQRASIKTNFRACSSAVSFRTESETKLEVQLSK